MQAHFCSFAKRIFCLIICIFLRHISILFSWILPFIVAHPHLSDLIFDYSFPGGSDGKASACNAGDPGSVPGLGRSSGEGHGYPPQYSCRENPHGQRSLEDYSPWGRRESDMTEWLTHTQWDILYLFRCVGICTDVAKAMISKTAGTQMWIKTVASNCSSNHCILHHILVGGEWSHFI